MIETEEAPTKAASAAAGAAVRPAPAPSSSPPPPFVPTPPSSPAGTASEEEGEEETGGAGRSAPPLASAPAPAAPEEAGGGPRRTSPRSRRRMRLLRLLFLDLPSFLSSLAALASLSAYGLALLAEHLYDGPVQDLISSMRLEDRASRSMGPNRAKELEAAGYDPKYYPELDGEITYYDRRCTIEDVTARTADELLLSEDVTRAEAADAMMTHGAVVLKNVLSQSTAAELREYLESRHEIHESGKLGYLEEFWSEIGRLALGLGAEDDPIVAKALEEVGRHEGLKRTLEGMLGEDPAVVEVSTLSAMHGCEEQDGAVSTRSRAAAGFYADRRRASRPPRRRPARPRDPANGGDKDGGMLVERIGATRALPATSRGTTDSRGTADLLAAGVPAWYGIVEMYASGSVSQRLLFASIRSGHKIANNLFRIHTDSDYFGSSLLYSRTFLHSYTMFVALQDTTSRMGATTVCPGTHRCADEDLERVCLDEDHPAGGPAFEVSSNGRTGNDDGGVLRRGDALMFDQNVWHRGPRNLDPERPTNRVMFIVTFASRRRRDEGDARVQGMGTYYYQRWNMWGHAHADLKDAASTMASAPRRVLRALGLSKPSRRSWGVPWPEHFARQLGNEMDFFAAGELSGFVETLVEHGWGSWIEGVEAEEWNAFLRGSVRKVRERLGATYRLVAGACVGASVAMSVAGRLMARWMAGRSGKAAANSYPWAWWRRIVAGHAVVAFLGWTLWGLLGRSHLMRRIESGEIFRAPFPNGTEASPAGKTALPERMDYLVGSRFDADFLAVYNRVLDYHPGNRRLDGIVSQYSNMPIGVVLERFRRPVRGVVPRVLSQEWATGHWTLMDEPQVQETVHRLTIERRSPLVRSLHAHLKTVLADSRFGTHRDTAMARTWTPAFVAHWRRALFGAHVPMDGVLRVATGPAVTPRYVPRRTQAFGPFAVTTYSAVADMSDRGKTFLGGASGTDPPLEVGDRVYADPNGDGSFYEAIVWSVPRYGEAVVKSVDSSRFKTVPAEAMHRYRPVVEGDEVEVVDEDGWSIASVTRVHPLAMFDVLYEDGEMERFVSKDRLRLVGQKQVTILHDAATVDALEDSDDEEYLQEEGEVSYQVGQPVQANYQDEGEWFDGHIVEVNQEDGTYDVFYDIDGEMELSVPSRLIRLMTKV
ncbi:hypothetical protein ACHAWF_016782 [Thalassiosira exigua]